MSVTTLKTVVSNTAPPLAITAQRDGTVINLAGCTVNLIITQGTTTLNTGHQGCTITNALNGIVSYVRQAGDIPTPGAYICDLQVTYGDGTVEILYDQLKIKARKKAGT